MGNRIMNIALSLRGQIGAGSLRNIAKQCARAGIHKPLIVTDRTMVEIGVAKRVVDMLSHADMQSALYDACVENPRVEDVAAGAKKYLEASCDGIIGLGGGSPIDQAKMIRVVAKYGGTAVDYDVAAGGTAKIKADIPPMIAIPTTSGTGSEATPVAVITDTKRHAKFVVLSPYIKPNSIVLDPELTRTMPPKVTAATGFDALVHSMESFVTLSRDPFAYSMNRTVFELVGKSLKNAVDNGDDLRAREDMAVASLMAGAAFAITGLGAVHALAHPLTALFGIPHGTANALMLPHVMEFNAAAVQERYIAAVKLIGFDVHSISEAILSMKNLARSVGLPITLTEAGVTEDLLDQLATDAFNDASHGSNPVPVTREALLAMYKSAL